MLKKLLCEGLPKCSRLALLIEASLLENQIAEEVGGRPQQPSLVLAEETGGHNPLLQHLDIGE
jgi:hypothetical protein